MVKRKCDNVACGKTYEAQRSTSKYCSKSCRVRVSQTRSKLVLVQTARPAVEMPSASDAAGQPSSSTGGILAATRAELEQLGAVDTTMGQLALRHAARLEFVPDTASGTAALSRELRQVIDAVRAGSTGGRGDRFDEISKRRRAKHEAAGS